MINVTVKEGVIEVLSPYSEEFVSFAHMRNGKWSKKKEVWMFDPRDEFAVRSALIDIYGTDDYETCEKVDVRINLDLFDYTNRIFACGCQLLWRKYPNKLIMADNVVVAQGGFKDISKIISPLENTIIEARAVPKQAAINFWKEHTNHVEILGELSITQLKDEKERLIKQIKEIDETITMLEKEEGNDLADLLDKEDEAPGASS